MSIVILGEQPCHPGWYMNRIVLPVVTETGVIVDFDTENFNAVHKSLFTRLGLSSMLHRFKIVNSDNALIEIATRPFAEPLTSGAGYLYFEEVLWDFQEFIMCGDKLITFTTMNMPENPPSPSDLLNEYVDGAPEFIDKSGTSGSSDPSFTPG